MTFSYFRGGAGFAFRFGGTRSIFIPDRQDISAGLVSTSAGAVDVVTHRIPKLAVEILKRMQISEKSSQNKKDDTQTTGQNNGSIKCDGSYFLYAAFIWFAALP